ncbi:MAG TPA: hypothetical protein VJU61_19395, partial [Polyangiaceae bacterium]|nr:hypothetical protein [Polyangiaceae bacterium]
EPERPTAASAIGAALYHAVGFNTSCEQIVYFDPSVLSLKPGLKATDNSGITKAFDATALARVLGQAVHRGNLVRMQASAWLPGYLIGPFRYESVRGDDPNDAIPHEDRRDLRGARVLAAWINHFDAREQNTMDSWIADNPEAPDSSPGHVRHFYLDTSDSFGSLWDWDDISRRLGNSYLLDFGYIAADFATLGLIERPWERAQKTPGGIFGYFHYRDFDPDAWKNEYPNPAFSSADEHDNAWMTRILSRLDREDIEALVSLGKFTSPEHARFLTDILERRLERIVNRYFAQLSPLADPRPEAGSKLCLTDLARRRAPGSSSFRYRARLRAQGAEREVAVEVHDAGDLCLALPHVAARGGARDDDPSRYVVVGIENGQAEYALGVHLYDLGPENGFRVVGLERSELGLAELLGSRP